MGENEISYINPKSGTHVASVAKIESRFICTLVSSSCIECVIKSRMTRECHVRFCEQLRGEIPLG